METNYYGVLDVSETASQADIRRAYLRLIQAQHPDRNPHPEAGSRAAGITEAYAVLSDPWKRALYDAKRNAPANPPATPRAWWVRPAVAAIVVVCAFVVWGVYAVATARGDNSGSASVGTRASAEAARVRVAGLIDRLCGTVSARAPIAGTHTESGTLVTDRAIDRSKFDSHELNEIADAIQKELDGSPDPDGFIAGAYFNARLFATSVELRARIDRGEPFVEQIAEVRAMNRIEAVRGWLEGSHFATAYADLVDRLAQAGEQYQTGRPSAEMEAELKSRNEALDRIRALIDADTLSGNTKASHSRAVEHDRLAEEAKLLAQAIDARSRLAQDLDLAFNRALDPSMLFGAR